ncbi:lysosomal acid glucosylceramidase [Drosophila guanche]|uniref:Glucosylceramidase n=1 Tax=Drosophila guanche TaxID=7266 RepID=A0A3B0K5D5_DROGU|nr:lysosomal acid glucosylceramidase [Drosophila guanche]SPP81209.1 blast:Glucosylceramidase [Drosophila guanche]
MSASKGVWLFAVLLLIAAIGGLGETVPCKVKDGEQGKLCVCTADYCDYLENPTLTDDTEFALISSSKQGLRFATSSGHFETEVKYTVKDYVEPVPETKNETIFSRMLDQAMASAFTLESRESTITRSVTLKVNRSKTHQTMAGFGGSYTGAVSYLVDNFKQPELADHLFKSFYAEEGLGFNLMRISIGGCDFDLSAWAYAEEEGNTNLDGMDELDERDVLRVSHIKRLVEVSGVKNLRIKGAAWSAPPWMKTNNKWTGFGRLQKQYYQTWADYHLKWVKLMEDNGLPIWAISTGNEPLNGIVFMYFVRFMSMGWTPQAQAIWLNDHLGPTIRNSEFKDIILFGNDDQRYSFPHWFKMMNNTRPNSVDYLDGLSLHWYWDEIFGISHIDETTEYAPDKLLIVSESCIGDKPWQKAAPILGSWERAEKYSRAFLQNLQHGFHGWIDWNIILDEEGGPNYVDNTVDAPVIANTTTNEEFYKQPMFYAMGHFSKLVPEGSIRVDAVPSNVNLDTVAFLRPDKKIATVLFNSGRADLDITVVDSERGQFTVNVPAKSIHTLLHS